MNKIPVGATIVRAYGFAFGNIVGNLGAIWIPAAILCALTYLFYQQYMRATLDLMTREPQSMLEGLRFLLAACAVAFVLLTAQIAALTREALGLRTGNAFLQFPFGAAAWRLMATYLLYFVVMIVIYIGCVLVGAVGSGIVAVVGTQLGTAGRILTGAVAIAFMIAVCCALIYIAVRLSFLMAPVAVAEQRVSLIRAWQLGQGNFWRMFAVFLSVLLPLLVLEFAILYFVYGSAMLPPLHATPDQLEAFARHQQETSRQMMLMSQKFWYIVYPGGLVAGLIIYGLISGASAFAYRALVPATADAERAELIA
jgi:hypothetical protein